MRKSLASIVGNIGNSIGLGLTPTVRIKDFDDENNESNDFEISSKKGTYGLTSSSKKFYISPSRPIGLPPPLPYNTNDNNNNNKESEYTGNIDNNFAISSSLENTRILTPFNIRNGIHSLNNNNKEIENGILYESNMRMNNNIGEKTPQTTKSNVRIKSIGITPNRFENTMGNLIATNNNNNNNNNSTLNSVSVKSSIFTPLSTKTRFLPILPTSPRKDMYENLKTNLSLMQKENNSQSLSTSVNDIKMDSSFSEGLILTRSVSNAENDNLISETLDQLRKRLNEKNQQVHFLNKTIKDLEARIMNLENKEKNFVENEVNNKKRMDELMIERHENMEKINNFKKEIIQLQQVNNNILKENKCINGNYELKCYEIEKLNDEINNIQNTYKNNFTLKYLTPLKNILYESIKEIERKIGNETILNVEFEKNEMEMDLIIKTLHEYIQNFKNFIILKIDQDYNIIENLHSELSKVNHDFLELKKEYINLKNSFDSQIKRDDKDSTTINIEENDDNNNNNNNNSLLNDSSPNNSESGGILGTSKIQIGLTSLAKSLLGYTYLSRTNTNNSGDIDHDSINENDDNLKSKLKKDKISSKSKRTNSKKQENRNEDMTINDKNKSKKKVLKSIDKIKNQKIVKKKSISKIEKDDTSINTRSSKSKIKIAQETEEIDNSKDNEIEIEIKNKTTRAKSVVSLNTAKSKTKKSSNELTKSSLSPISSQSSYSKTVKKATKTQNKSVEKGKNDNNNNNSLKDSQGNTYNISTRRRERKNLPDERDSSDSNLVSKKKVKKS